MTGLLEGVRVLDASRVLAGPFAGQVLAEMGAEVIELEFPSGDPARNVGRFVRRDPARHPRPAPRLGTHTNEVAEVLGPQQSDERDGT